MVALTVAVNLVCPFVKVLDVSAVVVAWKLYMNSS